MTEQPDIAAIRAELRAGEIYPPQFKHSAGFYIWSVLAALDTARAERDDANHEVMLERERAEAAEAQRDAERRMKDVAIAERVRAEAECSKQNDRAEDWKERHHRERRRAHAAETRIEAALEIVSDSPDWALPEPERSIRRVLTGETP